MDLYVTGLWKNKDDQYTVCGKSITGYVMTLGGCTLHWVSKIQTDISQSTLEDEYIALSQAMHDILHLRRLLQEVGNQLKTDFAYPIIIHSTVFEDTNGNLGLATSPRTTPRSSYISVKYNFFMEHVGEGKEIMIQRVEFKEKKADVFTKESP